MAYTVIKELGRGGFGIVELVTDGQGMKFARKTLNLSVCPPEAHSDFRKRFEREVRYQQSISHPNIVEILDSDLSGPDPWFIMPCANESLADALNQDRSLNGEYTDALSQILQGLEFLHDSGFYHRDFKPDNILIFREEDGTKRYKISDFGLSTPGAGQTSTLTGTNMGGGTLLYRAPECAVDFKRATHLADIYAVGAILHDIFGNGATRTPHLELNLTGPIGEVISKCTKVKARRRLQSVIEVRAALFQAIQETNVTFTSTEEEEVVAILKAEDSPSSEQWDNIFDLLEGNEDAGTSNDNVLTVLTSEHILSIRAEDPGMFSSLATMYSNFLSSGVFGFDFCDVLTNRAKTFYEHADLPVRSQITLGLMLLGISHNRWYVARTFMEMAGPKISDEQAARISAEVIATEFNFKYQFSRVCQCITTDNEQLHPTLRNLT
ncbi:serine/threonine-protein kinase [Shimia sp. MIT910701]|uniref:serine/threonine-protein kinase n=1 Tax=Shimia sp. MIT910701 TaxID=3096987 RepID=UPI00399BB095